MEAKRRNLCWVSFLVMVLSIILISGCPKSQQTVPTETAPASAGGKKEAPGSVTPVAEEGPIASGLVLLNFAVSKDAKIIQSRLAELGLYQGAIDGIWGKLSRAALKSFKEQNSLENPGKWDKETQMLLFRGTNK